MAAQTKTKSGSKKTATTKTAAPTTTTTDADKRKAAFKKLKALATKRGINLRLGSELSSFSYIPSGLPQIDALGGPCHGRFVVIYGPEGSGKSTYMYRQIAAAQKLYPDKVACLVDVEERIDPEWMAAQGVDMENLAIIQGHDTLEEYCDATRHFIQSGLISLMVIDTISAMTPAIMFKETASEKNIMNRDHVAKDAVKIAQFIRLTKGDIFKTMTACVIVAQARTHGIGGTHTYVGLSGGYMLKHMALQIWQFMALRGAADTTYEQIKVDGKNVRVLTHFRIRALLEKDTGPNVRKAAFLPFIVGTGFDDEESIINTGLRFGCVLQTSASWFVWEDKEEQTVKLNGRKKVVEYFRDHADEKERLLTKIAESFHEAKKTSEDDAGPIESQIWETDL